jgi:MFS transporter, MHS family, proline/betaine transporter
MKQSTARDRLAGFIGNFLEHYDNALFGLLTPFLAPLFFEGKDPVTALILTYGMLPLGLATRPLGSLFFGWIGDRLGPRYALTLTLTGMGLVTIAMGSIPLYREIGPWAPFFLALGRMLQGFFAAGEVSGGAIFLMEKSLPTERSILSSLYDACSLGGALLASGLVTYLSARELIEEEWRYLFWVGGVTALLGLFLRWSSGKSEFFIAAPRNDEKLIALLKIQFKPFFQLFLASGFCYTTYAFGFTLMNGFIPLVTNLSKTEAMRVNTLLLVYDMLLLPLIGILASRFGKEKIMLAGAASSVFLAVPLFHLLGSASLGICIAVRAAIITSGVIFSAPYYAWAIEQVPPRHRYLILSLAGALGSQLIGMPASAICLWLYKQLGWSFAPGLYLLASGAAGGLAVFLSFRKKSFRLRTE